MEQNNNDPSQLDSKPWYMARNVKKYDSSDAFSVNQQSNQIFDDGDDRLKYLNPRYQPFKREESILQKDPLILSQENNPASGKKIYKYPYRRRTPIYVETKNLMVFFGNRISPNMKTFSTIKELRTICEQDEYKEICLLYFYQSYPILDIMDSRKLQNRRSAIRHIRAIIYGIQNPGQFNKIKGVI